MKIKSIDRWKVWMGSSVNNLPYMIFFSKPPFTFENSFFDSVGCDLVWNENIWHQNKLKEK